MSAVSLDFVHCKIGHVKAPLNCAATAKTSKGTLIQNDLESTWSLNTWLYHNHVICTHVVDTCLDIFLLVFLLLYFRRPRQEEQNSGNEGDAVRQRERVRAVKLRQSEKRQNGQA